MLCGDFMEYKDVLERFYDDIYKLFSKYHILSDKNSFDIFFNNIFDIYEKYKNSINDIDTHFVSSLYRNTIELNKEEYNHYIRCMKRYKIYKYKKDFIPRLLFKIFPKIYLFIYFYRRKVVKFFVEKSKFLQSYTGNKLLYSIESKKGLRYFPSNKLYLNYIEVVITTKCTLKCRKCANLIPMYKKPYNCDKQLLNQSLSNLFKVVDRIEVFKVLGGEAFCNNDLYSYLKMIHYDKVGEVHIVTNATVVPKDKKLINLLRDRKIVVEISNYGKYSYKLDELISILNSNNIKYLIYDLTKWYDYGDVVNYKKSESLLSRQFHSCNIKYKSLLNAKLYYCPRSSHGSDLKLIPEIKDEYVDLVNNDYKILKKKIRKLYKRKKYIEACKYCKFATDDCKTIKPAEQLGVEV